MVFIYLSSLYCRPAVRMKLFFLIVILCVFNDISMLSMDELQYNTTEPSNINYGKNYNDLPTSNFFLDYLFKKYGNLDGKISYEGFEHLLENLGLGQLRFNEHSLEEHKNEEGNFEEMHDILQIHIHNHKQNSRNERSIKRTDEFYEDENTGKYTPRVSKLMVKRCFTPEEMLMIYQLQPNHEVGISPSNFLHMCPVIVYELDQKSCSFIHEPSNMLEPIKNDSIYYVWLSALISVFIISAVGLLGVCLVPLLQKTFFNEIISFLVALAIGTLCGDSLLHLLPHAFEPAENENSNVIVLKAGTVFLTIIVFFLIETFLATPGNKVTSFKEEDSVEGSSDLKVEIQMQENSMLPHSHSYAPCNNSSISSVALMVVMGDGLHNLTDGLAIGAAFSGDVISGFSTAIAVFTHELPHELGDFAVLLSTGMTVSQAMLCNILSSILSFIGMVIGLLIGNFTCASQWIYAITAGAFLYIGLVNLVPEIKKPVSGSRKTNIVIQILGILSGGLIMLLIALFEHDIEEKFLQ